MATKPTRMPPEQPIHDVSIEFAFWPAKRGERKPTLYISADALVEFLTREEAVIAPGDIARLLGALHTYAARNDGSDPQALAQWETIVESLEGTEEDE